MVAESIIEYALRIRELRRAGRAISNRLLLQRFSAFSNPCSLIFPQMSLSSFLSSPRRAWEDPTSLSNAPVSPRAPTVRAEDAFDAMLALLSATSYTLRFAEDLEDVFPHVPLPSDHALFLAAAEVGREIRAVETFARPPGSNFLARAVARVETEAAETLHASDWTGGEFFLCANGTGRVSGISEAIWSFSVSGYRLLPRWLAARQGLAVDHALISAVRDVVGRIAALIDHFARADRLLIQILPATLTKSALGLGE